MDDQTLSDEGIVPPISADIENVDGELPGLDPDLSDDSVLDEDLASWN